MRLVALRESYGRQARLNPGAERESCGGTISRAWSAVRFIEAISLLARVFAGQAGHSVRELRNI